MILESFPVGPLECNCVVLGDETTRDGIVIDPGDEPEAIDEVLDHHKLSLKYVVHTHGHIDHILAADHLRKRTGARVLIHEADMFLWQALQMQASFVGMHADAPGPIDGHLKEGDVIRFGPHELKVIETPGHSPGSVCLLIENPTPVLFSGDTIFLRGIGRTDLWGGSYPHILRSIHDRLFTLGEETLVHPGHGPLTTIRDEKRGNPFLDDIVRVSEI